jgi:hypothetical protein
MKVFEFIGKAIFVALFVLLFAVLMVKLGRHGNETATELAYQRQLLQKHTRQLEELDSLIHLYPFPPSEKLVKGIRINTGFSKRLHKMEGTE